MNYKKLYHSFVELLWPSRCLSCDRPLLKGEDGFCRHCLSKKPEPIRGPRCYRCSKPVSSETIEYCTQCTSFLHAYERGFAAFSYATVQEMILRYKNAGRPGYADWFSGQICAEFLDELKDLHADALIPIPLLRKKEWKRGYNQSGLIAERLGKALEIPVYEDALRNVKTGGEQKGMSSYGRRNNSKNAFILYKNDVKLKTVILVDDVYTTGSTMDAAAAALKEGGTEQVYFVTIAIGNPMQVV